MTESAGQLLQQHPDADLYVIGHSMGAAMAHVCVLDLKFRYALPRERVYLYTFGSPRIGNDIFARFLEDQVQVRHSTLAPTNPVLAHYFSADNPNALKPEAISLECWIHQKRNQSHGSHTSEGFSVGFMV